ncbi:MAG: filamentous hemagglutinin N-terminal domain-containing protein [Rhodopseudomonas sp.]|nr:filamentous hemagglutinin N-terminal domain-containing protein [Rhodopseudomonas sp.]
MRGPDRLTKAMDKPSRRRTMAAATVRTGAVLFALSAGGPTSAQQLPTGGTVTSGGAAIVQPNANTLNINQSTDKAIIDWQSFSVGQGGTVNFNQPSASSATLNRVLGSTPSWIAGTINAPGTVLLVNPNGIAITKDGVVNTGSFAASTLDIKDSDFLSGNYKFSGNGASAGVINNGQISVSDGGFAALLGGQVSNNGVIAARLGKVGLGAGEMATLDLAGDGFLSVAVPSTEAGKLVDAKGALVSNRGKIVADGGTVYLSAATAANILRNAVNIPGAIRTNTVGSHNGRIVINGGTGGTVKVTGRLAAKGRQSGETGGGIDITGANVKVIGALIDASGAAGGGTVEIGGGLHGGGVLAHAQSVSIDSTTVIRADATDSGDGGVVVAWSDGQTTANGTFSARGGVNGGDGGIVETSGHSVDFTGINVSASAARGAAGTWLVDPTSLTIDSAAATTIANTLNAGTSVTLQTNPDGTTSGPGTASSGAGDIIFASELFASGGLNTTLTVQAYNNIVINGGGDYVSIVGSFNAQAGGTFTLNGTLTVKNLTVTTVGDMSFNGSLTVNGTSTLFTGGNINFTGSTNNLGSTPVLTAGGDIQILAPTGSSAGATLNAYGNINFAANFTNYGNFGTGPVTLRADIDGNGSGTLNFSNGATFAAGGAGVTIYYNPTSYASPTSFSGTVTGAGSLTAYMLVNSAANLSAISNNLGGTYALGRDIDLSGVDFLPIGWSATVHNFTGVFDGQNHVITNMAIGSQTERYFLGKTGLFWEVDGTVRNLGVTGSISDGYNNYIGGLAGVVGSSGTISNSWSAVSVDGRRGDTSVGGLVGLNLGHITGGSYATGSVSGGNYVGGLVGENRATIDNSYATGSVSGPYAGGLLGFNRTGALVNYTYALGSVNGSIYTGGLVGWNEQSIAAYGTIMNSYAAGHLSGSSIGGIAGYNGWDPSENQNDFNSQNGQSGKVWWTVWDADSTGTNKAFGSSYLDRSGYSSENVQFIGFVSTNASLTSANGGGNLGNPYLTSSYNFIFSDPTPGNTDMQATGFAAHWYMINGSTRPFLSAEYSTTIQNSHQLQLIDMDGTASYSLARDLTYTNDGMWTSAGFSPIAPQTAFNVELKVYGSFDLNVGSGLPSSTQSGNNVVVVIAKRGPLYPINQTLVSDTYTVSYVGQDFTGTFNGNGHTITNLTSTVTSGNGGLFGAVASGGTVENLGLINPQIYADNHLTGIGSVGSVAGYNAGTIYSVYATGGSVSSWFAADTGGLVGTNVGLVTQSYANVSVAGVNQGYDPQTGYPTSTFYDHDGGLVGANYGQITNTYALGWVAGNGAVGGLVGYNSGTVANSYTTGQTGRNYNYGINAFGALVGNNQGNVFNSFWDSTVATNNSGAGTGLSTAQMQDLNSYTSTYSGWDFFRVWAPPNQAGQGGQSTAYYPQLYASSNIVVLTANDASQQYGATTPTFTGGLYSLADIGRLSSYTIGALSSSATSSSSVGTYSIGLQQAAPAVSVGTQTGCSFSYCSFYLSINGYIVGGGTYLPPASAASLINGFTNITHVTASVDAGGHLVLTSSSSFTVYAPYSGAPDPYGVSGTFTATPGSNASASMMNGSTPRMLFLPGTLTVTPAPLTITANGVTKTYGQTVVNGSTGYSTSGLVNGDSVASVSFSSTGLAATANVDGGPYSITPSNAQGTGLSNYTITYVNGTLTITPATLTYTADSGTMTYGATVPGLTGTVTGFVNGETLGSATTGNLTFATNATLLSNVGNYDITGSGLSANHGNYTFVQAAANTNAFSVTPAEIVVTANGGTSIYGESPANPGLSASGLQNGQDVSVLTGLSNSFGIGPTTGVVNGGYTLSVLGTLTNANYTVTTRNTGTWTVTPAQITVTANGGTSVYGTSPSDPGLSANGLQNGEDVGVLTGLSNSFGIGPTTSVGGGPYTLSVLGTLTNANYTITARNTGTWTVTPASYTAISGAKTYDGNAAFGSDQVTLTGVNGETFTVGAVANSANASSNPNSPSTGFISVTGPIVGQNGADPSNYVAPVASSLTGASNVASIAKATYTAISGVKTYDGTTAFAAGDVTLSGVNGETFNVAATGNAANASTNPTDPTTYLTASSGPIAGINGADPNNYNALDVGTLTGTNNVAVVNLRALTVTADDLAKTYGDILNFNGAEFSTNGLQNGETIGSVALASAGQAATAGVAGGPYAIAVSNAAGGTFDINNYAVSYVGGHLTVNPADIVVTALGGRSTYGESPSDPGISASNLQNGEDVSVLTGLANSFGITNVSGAGNHTLSVAGLLTNPNYHVTQTVDGVWTVDPATLTYVANPSTRYFGDINPLFSGTVTGFVNGETLATATTGTLLFTSPATPTSLVGQYPIEGSGLSAANYIFVQADGNATALTVATPPTTPGSQVSPPGGGNPPNDVNISFTPPGGNGGPIQVSFTPTRTANNSNGADATPAALPSGIPSAGNNGYDFLPISQYDANQYSQFKLPDYDAKAGAATVFTIIARAISADHAADFMIDGFWNGTAGDWAGATGQNPVNAKVTFSDGEGHNVAPTDANAFPIVAGKTDIAALLKSGPVMIGGAAGQGGWMLATGLTPDGKGIVCDDPVTGKQVTLGYDPQSHAVGGVTGIYDAKTKGFVALASAGDDLPQGAGVPAALQNFTPTTYFSVGIH